METRSVILQELEQISHEVAIIGNNNVFTVPEGYFDAFPSGALIKVQMDALRAMPVPFTVPGDYFATLAGEVLAKIKGENIEAADASTIADFAVGSPRYTVPDSYFDNLAGSVMAKIKALEVQKSNTEAAKDDEPGFLHGVEMPYSVPVGYFDNLAGSIMAKIKAGETKHSGNEVFEELAAIAPALNNISKAMPFSVPAGYFEQLNIKVPAAEKQEAKVISLKAGRSQKWYTYAVAACVAVLLGIGGYMFVPSRGGDINPKTFDIKKALAGVSVDDINSYLDNQPSVSPEAAPTTIEDQVPDVQMEIENMSTQEIQQYLKENSDPGENRGKHI